MRTQLVALGIALLVALAVATAVHASPIPDDAGSDCSWHENGTTIQVGDETYTCHCAQLTGPMGPQVLCRWWNVEKLPAKTKKIAAKPKARKHVARVYPKPAVVG